MPGFDPQPRQRAADIAGADDADTQGVRLHQRRGAAQQYKQAERGGETVK